jgi:serine/threonine protein kinase
VGTLGYRAPEVLFGDTQFGTAIDVFALGVVLVELAGGTCFRDAGKQWTAEVWQNVLFKQLGTPVAKEIIDLPHFPPVPPTMAKKPFGRIPSAALGPVGEALADCCLQWAPCHRPTCQGILEHKFVLSGGGRLALGGVPEVWVL